MQQMRVWPLGQEDPLGKKTAVHSSIFAWEIPWTEEPGGLQSLGSQRFGHDWATKQEQWPVGEKDKKLWLSVYILQGPFATHLKLA